MPVYFVSAGDRGPHGRGPVKIGHSQAASLVSRFAALQSSNHEKLSVIRILDGSYALERALHQRFKPLWLHGEWFAFDPKMLGDLGAPDSEQFAGIEITLPFGAWTDARRAEIAARIKRSWLDPEVRANRLRAMRYSIDRKAAA